MRELIKTVKYPSETQISQACYDYLKSVTPKHIETVEAAEGGWTQYYEDEIAGQVYITFVVLVWS